MVVGLIGCGRWGKHVLRDLVALGCDVPVVARSPESRSRASKGRATAIVEDIDSLPRVDGIVVATPTSTHAAVVENALGLGVPVYVEKPLSDDPDAAARLALAAPDRLFVMDKWRYHPGVRELERIAREQSLGPVSGLRTLRLGWDTAHDDVDAVWVLAPHDLSVALEIMGAVGRPRSATAQWLGERATLLSGTLAGEGWWHLLDVSSRSAEKQRRIELHCAHGVAVLGGGWDEHVSVFRANGDEPEEERIQTSGELPLLAELRAFVEHLDGGPPPRSSAAEGALVVAVIAELRSLSREP